jgi:UDP-glucuronate 4-epimerase
MILVTGCAGFIGMHTGLALLAAGERVLGIDDLNAYYDPALKRARLARLTADRNFIFHQLDIADHAAMRDLARSHQSIDRIVHLAAQPGVRHSLIDPFIYVTTNVMGHLAVLETARLLPDLRHLVYASSSSVYGGNETMPFTETDDVSRPVSLYAATKRSGELIAETYRHLHGLPQTGLRFFTVYGPWGRPDMAVYAFATAITAGRPITLYEGAGLARDFTYIDDIVAGILGTLDRPPNPADPARILNVGNERPEPVAKLVSLLEHHLGRRAQIEHVLRPATDVESTFASIDAIRALTGYQPQTTLDEGVARFTAWFRDYELASSAAAATSS